MVLICDGGRSYPDPESQKFLSALDLSEGQKMYNSIRHLEPHLSHTILNRKFFVQNQIRTILKQKGPSTQVLLPACGWDPLPVRMSKEFPKNSFFCLDRDSVHIQKKWVQKRMPQAPIFYSQADITDSDRCVQLWTKQGWNKNKPSLIVLEGITYYIPPTPFWSALKKLTRTIQSEFFICGDFLVDGKQQKISPLSQKMGKDVFDMIKKSCGQKYYPYSTKKIKQKLKEHLNCSHTQCFTQDEVQKQRTTCATPWKQKEGHIVLFTAKGKKAPQG